MSWTLIIFLAAVAAAQVPDSKKCGIPKFVHYCGIPWTGFVYNHERKTCQERTFVNCYEGDIFKTWKQCQETCEDTGMTFTSTPTFILPPFTQELDMICELWNVPDVKHVVSIGITRGEQRIASISDYHPPQADVDQITVEGNVTGTTGSYLKVEWSHPDMTQVGEYRCDITVIYTDGHPGRLEDDLEVKGPTFQDIVKVLIRQQEEITKLEEEITIQEEVNKKQEEIDTILGEEITQVNISLGEEIAKQKEVNTKQEEVNTKQEEVNSEVQDQLDDVDNEIAEVKGKVHELGHVETGTVEFDNSTTWPTAPGDRHQKDITVTFQSEYKSPPSVLISVNFVDAPRSRNDRRNCYVISKNNQGFTIRCFTWDDSFYYQLNVSWISVAGNWN